MAVRDIRLDPPSKTPPTKVGNLQKSQRRHSERSEESLLFVQNDDVVTVADGTSIAGKTGQAYSIGIQLPAAGLLGLGLAAGIIAALGASAVRRRKL